MKAVIAKMYMVCVSTFSNDFVLSVLVTLCTYHHHIKYLLQKKKKFA